MRMLAPSSRRICSEAITSLMQARFSIRHLSAARMVAGRMATAAFLAPPMTTSPERGVPPRITNFSKWLLSFELYGPAPDADRTGAGPPDHILGLIIHLFFTFEKYRLYYLQALGKKPACHLQKIGSFGGIYM